MVGFNRLGGDSIYIPRESAMRQQMRMLDTAENIFDELDRIFKKKLEEGAFLGLVNLEGLFLRHCSLSSITTFTFRSLKKLRSLWLDENNLITLPDKGFQYLSQLETL
ncbi:hypothetical protein NPIL_10551 [Nephila pilipes]|uniref:Uncharacterized protein n=1 Tax=Nephila pilipes TaxID=299642 RepID=A0A8X6MHJ6_NEPPI|nr:hypothetical protein NPIL_10551 [Nephila pilipes]